MFLVKYYGNPVPICLLISNLVSFSKNSLCFSLLEKMQEHIEIIQFVGFWIS